jgi:hypothetical protein
MEVHKVDHILRAAGAVTGQMRFGLIGSASIFAWRADVPEEMALTREADLFACDVDEETAERIADELDASLGQSSPFDETYGYYCDGVGPQTAILPSDWRNRAKPYSSPNTGHVVAIVPHPNDVALAKLCAGREKDMDWLKVAARHAIIDLDVMRANLAKLPTDRTPGAGILEQRLTTIAAGL